jgi:hypothetical protein
MTAPATIEEIVETFNALDFNEIVRHNWGTCGKDCQASWSVNDETYINGVMLTIDFDYMMGYLVQAVDRTDSTCRYIAILQRHGRKPDGSIDYDYEWAPDTHGFFDKEFDRVQICQWAVEAIYRMVGYPGA